MVDMDKSLRAGKGRSSRLAPDATGTGMWQWNVTTDITQWSDNLWDLYGITDRSVPAGFTAWLDSICLPDRERVFHTVRKATRAKKAFDVEWRVRQEGDQPARWLQTHGRPLRDGNGILTYYIGMVFDITGHRETAHERDLWANTFRLATQPLAIFSIHTAALIAVNDACARRLGYTPDKLRNKSLTSIFPRAEWKKISEFIAAVKQKGYETLDTSYRCKDGSCFTGRAEAGALDNGNGIYDRALLCLSDTTRLKEAEARQKFIDIVFAGNADGIVLSDGTGKILAANREFERLSGCTNDTWHDRRLSDYLSTDKNFPDSSLLGIRPETQEIWRGNAWLHSGDGNLSAVSASSRWAEGDNRTAYYCITNISPRQDGCDPATPTPQHGDTDGPTGLPNRRIFLDRLEQEFLHCRRGHYASALLLLDLDNFKTINDTLGHAAGDMVLAEAAKRIRNAIREYDTVASLGRDEFAVIVSKFGIRSTVEQAAQKILDILATPFRIGEREIFLSASIGISIFPSDARQTADIIKCAGQAISDARSTGHNRYRFFTRQMQETVSLHTQLAQDIRHALRLHQMEVQYQPIIDMANGQICKAEALLRWTHPTCGPVSPAVFIPVAEETGIIGEIGDFVIQQTVGNLRQWQVSNSKPLEISINISPSQLREKHQWLQLAQPLAENGLRPHSLILEITEGVLMRDDNAVLDNLAHLHRAGMRIALDDFGTGYSSLSYLSKFEIDYLKIDKSFVDNLLTRSSDRVLCDAMIAMAHKLGCKVIAEGIETEGQRSLLDTLGCDYGQGYLFSRALPWPAFLDKIS